MKKAVTILLAVTFVVCVICYGTNKRFSFECWIENIAEGFSDIPSIQGIVDIWSNGLTMEIPEQGGDENSGVITGDDTERTNFFEKTLDFFKSVGTFFRNLWNTVLYLLNMLVAIFRLVGVLLPWNSTVEV